MKIVHINATYKIGSTGKIAFELQEFINNTSNNVCYTFFSEGSSDNRFAIKIGNLFSTKLHALLSRIFGLQGFFSLFSTKKLIDKITKINPDIILLSNLHANYINYKQVFDYAFKNNKHIVLILHDCWFYTGKCCHYTNIGCHKWKTGCGRCPKLHKDNDSWFFDTTKYLYNVKQKIYEKNRTKLHIIGVSDWITKESKNSILRVAENFATILNWIDLDVFKPNVRVNNDLCNKLAHKPYVISVASIWNADKGVDKIYQIAAKCSNIIFLLVGKKPNKFPLNIPNNIIFCGQISNQEILASLYGSALAYINLSLEESFGKVSAESISCGTPVICVDSTANKEIVGPGCGIVLKEFNVDLFVKSIIQIANENKKKYSENCILFASQKFDKTKQLDKYLHFLTRILKEN